MSRVLDPSTRATELCPECERKHLLDNEACPGSKSGMHCLHWSEDCQPCCKCGDDR